MPRYPDILIVGAGPTGLVLAIELARRNVDFCLIEKEQTPSQHSKALGIQARTLELFAQSGLSDSFLEHGFKARGLQLHLPEQTPPQVLDFSGLDTPYPFVMILPQRDTEQLLLDKLHSLGASVQRGTEFVHFSGYDKAEDGLSVTVRDSNGDELAMRTNWLIGCDGAHSRVRHAAGIEFPGQAYDEQFLLADLRLQGWSTDDYLHVFPGRGSVLALFPLGAERVRLVASHPPAYRPEKEQPTLTECQQVFNGRVSAAGTLSDPQWLSYFHIYRRSAERWRKGRVLLAGDAAHVHSPVGGQGMNTGIQDAYNLAWKLAWTATGKAPRELIDSYQVERDLIAKKVLRETDRMTKLVTLRNPVARFCRDRALPLFFARAPLRNWLMQSVSELSVNYHKRSPIVTEYAMSTGPRSGERALDANVKTLAGRQISLLSLFGELGFILLLLSGVNPVAETYRLLSAVHREMALGFAEFITAHLVCFAPGHSNNLQWCDSILLDTQGEVRRVYGKLASVYLIRPDGYISFRSPVSDGGVMLITHLISLFGDSFRQSGKSA